MTKQASRSVGKRERELWGRGYRIELSRLQTETGLAPVPPLSVVAVGEEDVSSCSLFFVLFGFGILGQRNSQGMAISFFFFFFKSPRAQNFDERAPSPSLFFESQPSSNKRGRRSTYWMVLPVLKRIHWGIGRFCRWALASFCLVRKLLWLCGSKNISDCHRSKPSQNRKSSKTYNVRSEVYIPASWRLVATASWVYETGKGDKWGCGRSSPGWFLCGQGLVGSLRRSGDLCLRQIYIYSIGILLYDFCFSPYWIKRIVLCEE